jgi:hypothetical protein
MDSPYFVMLKNKYKMGALKFVLAPKFYNSFLLVRADPAGAKSTTPHYLARTSVNTREKTKERDSANTR